MTADLTDRLVEAAGVSGVVAGAFDAFEHMLRGLRGVEKPAGGLLSAVVFAAAAGRGWPGVRVGGVRAALPPEPQQVPELAVAMRGLVGTATRYLDDVRIVMGVARGNPDVWNQALAEGRGAMRSAAAHLDCERCAAVWPQLREGPGAIRSDSLAGRLAAAVTFLTVARDLLHTHFTADPDGQRAEHSDWAPVIASAPVNRALLAGLADHLGAAARQVQTMHLRS